MKLRTGLLSLALVAAFAGAASAQVTMGSTAAGGARSKIRGFDLGVALNGSSLRGEDDSNVDSGGGLSLRLGYGLNDHVVLYIDAAGASMSSDGSDDSYTLGHSDFGVRYHFASSARALRPFLDAGVGARLAQLPLMGSDLELRGSSFSFGGGLHYFTSRRFALEAALKYSVGSFGEGRYAGSGWQSLGDDDLGASSVRVNLGIAFHP